MAELLYRLGTWSARRPWLVILSWIGILAVAAGGFLVGFRGLTSSFDVPGTASSEVIAELQDEIPEFAGASGTIVFHSADGTALTPEQRSAISDRIAGASTLPEVERVVDPFAVEAQRAEQLAQLDAGREQLAGGRQQLESGRAQLEQAHAQIDDARAQLDQAIAVMGPTPELTAQLAQLEAQAAQLEAQAAELDAQAEQLQASAPQLLQGAQLLELADGIRYVSEDGSTALATVTFTTPRLELSDQTKAAVVEYFDATSIPGVEVAVSSEIAQEVPQIIGNGEIIGLAIAAFVLFLMLRTVGGALIPLATAITGVGIGVMAALAFGGVVDMAVVTPVLAVMLGLAVGIDYSLFIINRHRRQLLAGADLRESIGLANGTSGNAVVFAGATVIVALLALNVTGIPFLGVMGTVAAGSILAAVLIAVTLTPALLGLAGERILSRRARAEAAVAQVERERGAAISPESAAAPQAPRRDRRSGSLWRPAVTAVIAIGMLAALAVPALSMRVGLPGGESEPQGSLSQQAYQLTEERFGAGATSPLVVTAPIQAGLDAAGLLSARLDIAQRIASVDGVAAVAPVAVSDSGTLAVFQVLPDGDPNSELTAQVVHDLRALSTDDGALGVAGQAAINIDISDRLTAVLPIYLSVVVGVSLLIMILVFRSILVPVIATGGFILSLFATYGALVAVFQWGWGAELFGITHTGPILNFLPIILVGILFGLAMDYQLFLATGMREAYVHGATARAAVQAGMRSARAVVTAAALIMAAIFGGFIFSESTIVTPLGFGLAVGILLDAFVVRMLLMPALMRLAGRGAWWIPRWLDRILPNVDVEGAALERRHHAGDGSVPSKDGDRVGVAA